MIKVSLTDIKKVGKWTMPLGVVALGMVVVVAGQAASSHPKAAVAGVDSATSQPQSAESPAPVANANVSVNGTAIPTDKNGSSDVVTPGGKAHVEVSGGHTQVTTSDSGTSGDTSSSKDGNVNIQVNSNQSNSGTTSGMTQVYGFSNSSDGGSTSSSNTSIFSTGTGNVSVHSQ